MHAQKNRSFDSDRKDGTSVTIKEVRDDLSSVVLVTIINGGHTWPGRDPFNIGYPLGQTTNDLDINEYMWNFFKKSSKWR